MFHAFFFHWFRPSQNVSDSMKGHQFEIKTEPSETEIVLSCRTPLQSFIHMTQYSFITIDYRMFFFVTATNLQTCFFIRWLCLCDTRTHRAIDIFSLYCNHWFSMCSTQHCWLASMHANSSVDAKLGVDCSMWYMCKNCQQSHEKRTFTWSRKADKNGMALRFYYSLDIFLRN